MGRKSTTDCLSLFNSHTLSFSLTDYRVYSNERVGDSLWWKEWCLSHSLIEKRVSYRMLSSKWRSERETVYRIPSFSSLTRPSQLPHFNSSFASSNPFLFQLLFIWFNRLVLSIYGLRRPFNGPLFLSSSSHSSGDSSNEERENDM